MALQSQKHGIPGHYGTEGREFESLLARRKYLQIGTIVFTEPAADPVRGA